MVGRFLLKTEQAKAYFLKLIMMMTTIMTEVWSQLRRILKIDRIRTLEMNNKIITIICKTCCFLQLKHWCKRNNNTVQERDKIGSEI
jgi:hypothetical protein